MDQHTFILPINGASSGVEFKELPVKLNGGEVLVGRNNDTPIPKPLGNLVEYYEGYYLSNVDEVELTPGQTEVLTANNIRTILDHFQKPVGATSDKGAVIDFDMMFFLNHIYEDEQDDPPISHFSLSAQITSKLIIMIDAAEDKSWYQHRIINQQGYWIKYDSQPGSFYEDVIGYNSLDFLNDPPPIIVSVEATGGVAPPGSAPSLLIDNNLLNYPAFPSEPFYRMGLKMKIKAREYSFIDHTYEMAKPK